MGGKTPRIYGGGTGSKGWPPEIMLNSGAPNIGIPYPGINLKSNVCSCTGKLSLISEATISGILLAALKSRASPESGKQGLRKSLNVKARNILIPGIKEPGN